MSQAPNTELDSKSASVRVRAVKVSILREWELLCRSRVAAAQNQTRVALLDAIPDFLDQLAITLESHNPKTETTLNSEIAIEHGEERASLDDYTLEEVIYEYHLLRSVILKTLEPEQRLSREASWIIHLFIDHGIRKASARFTQLERRRVSERQTDVADREEKFQQLAASLTDQVFHVMDLNPHKITYVSPSYETVWKKSVKSVYDDPHSFIDRIHPDDRHIVQAAMSLQDDGKESSMEYRLLFEDGSIKWIKDSSCPVKDSEGRAFRAAGIAQDITAQKLSAEALSKSESRMWVAADASGVGIWELDLRTKKVWRNERHDKIFGASEPLPEWSFEIFLGFVHPDDRARVQATMLRAMEGQSNFEFECRIIRLDKTERWMAASGQVIQTSDGTHPTSMVGTNIDITEKVLAVKSLAESESRFRTIANAMPQMVWSTLPDGFHDYYNDRWYEFTGVPYGSTDGEEWNGMFHPDDQDRAWKTWRHSLETGELYQIEYRLRHHSGEYRWTLGRAVPIKDENGKIIRWMGTCTDIEETTQVQHELLDTLESMSDAFFSIDREWQVTRVNTAMEKLSGLKREQQVGRNFLDLFFPKPEHRETKYWIEYHRVMLDRNPVRFEDFYEPLKIWTEVRAYPKSDGGVAVFYTDITQRKQSEARLQIVLDTIPIFAGVLDPQGTVTLINQIAVDAISETKSDVLGKAFWECSWWNPLPEVLSEVRDAISRVASGKAERFDTMYVSRVNDHSSKRWVDLSMTPVFGANGSVEAITASGFDITERIEQSQALIIATQNAENANKLKSAFLANMSHEIRTPLGVMIGFADLISEPTLDPVERKQFAQTLKRNGEQLGLLINDILDLSKVEAGHLNVEVLEFSLRGLIEEVLSGLNVKAREKNLRLSFRIDASTKDRISSDPTRLRQILFNVIGNAIKFTSVGQITLSVMQNMGTLEIEVEDTGLGIAPEYHSSLFKPFHQGDESMTRKFGGTGLGLALSKRLAQILGGDLSLKTSIEGKGSTFRLVVKNQLPLSEISKTAANSATIAERDSTQSLDGVTILLVEDSVDNQLLISRLLTKKGAHVEIANDGQEGMEKALNGQFQIVVMDVQMPILDGYAATQRLREAGYRNPIIALTAHAMSEARKTCLDVGYSDYLPKPINPDELIKTIVRHLVAT